MVKLERMPDNIASEQLDKIDALHYDKFELEKCNVKDSRYVVDRKTKEKVALIAYTEIDNSCGFGGLSKLGRFNPFRGSDTLDEQEVESEEVSTTHEVNTVTREVMITTNTEMEIYPYDLNSDPFEKITFSGDLDALVTFGEFIESHGYKVTIYY
jgi:hypothetical protein